MSQASPNFKICISGTAPEVRRALAQVRDELKAADSPEDQMGRVETVLAEVLNNIVEHALVAKSSKLIEVWGQDTGSSWQFRICDTGRPLPNNQLPAKELPSIDTGFLDLPEGGFGWAMVHMLTRDLTYTRLPDRNALEFTVPIQ